MILVLFYDLVKVFANNNNNENRLGRFEIENETKEL